MGSINERLTGIEVTTRNERKVRATKWGSVANRGRQSILMYPRKPILYRELRW